VKDPSRVNVLQSPEKLVDEILAKKKEIEKKLLLKEKNKKKRSEPTSDHP